MQHKTDVGDDADDVLSIAVIKRYCLVITGCHQHFWTSPFTKQLLLLVQRIADSYPVLMQHEFIEKRQIRGVIPNGILDQQYRPYTLIEDVMRRIELVLYQFDDSDNKVGGVVPVEEIIDVRTIVLLNAVVYLLAEGR